MSKNVGKSREKLTTTQSIPIQQSGTYFEVVKIGLAELQFESSTKKIKNSNPSSKLSSRKGNPENCKKT